MIDRASLERRLRELSLEIDGSGMRVNPQQRAIARDLRGRVLANLVAIGRAERYIKESTGLDATVAFDWEGSEPVAIVTVANRGVFRVRNCYQTPMIDVGGSD